MKNRLFLLLGGIALAAGGYFAAVATAAGVPTDKAETLYYAGYLTDASGTPLNGPTAMNIEVFSDPGADIATKVCETGLIADADVNNGHFRLALPATCVDAFAATADTWIRLTVGTDVLPASRVGAVPYALEAAHAVDSDNAINAVNAENATNATNAVNATSATNADNANTADSVEWAGVANKPPLTTFIQEGNEYSMGHTAFCGTIGSSVDGDMGGWQGVKALCEAGCNSPTAHICTSEEMIRWAATTGGTLGNGLSGGWYASGVGSTIGSESQTDCSGWSSSATTQLGGWWAASGYPSYQQCNEAWGVLCCDTVAPTQP